MIIDHMLMSAKANGPSPMVNGKVYATPVIRRVTDAGDILAGCGWSRRVYLRIRLRHHSTSQLRNPRYWRLPRKVSLDAEKRVRVVVAS